MSQFFFKYQGTGNDFIVIDDRRLTFPAQDKSLVSRLCDRKFGIGSDGILLIQDDEQTDFHVDFINPDGSRSFCGNGSRCAVAFAKRLGMIGKSSRFRAIDGVHDAIIQDDLVQLKMSDVDKIDHSDGAMILNTGSPHYIQVVESVDSLDVKKLGSSIRNSPEFVENGINVNFAERLTESSIRMRTYERGVEDETLSCGTGITAAVVAMADIELLAGNEINVEVKGGELTVSFFKTKPGAYTDIWLIGPAQSVFSGEVAL